MKALRPTTISFPSTGQFTRASTATYVEDGLVKTASNNIPRWQNGILLLEDSSTNLLTYSEQFDNAAWSKNNITVTANAILSPDNTVDAEKLVETATTSFHELTQSITASVGTKYTGSIFLKAAERSFAFVGFNGGGIISFVSVNLSNGQVSLAANNSTEFEYSSVKLENGWYRIAISAIASSAISMSFSTRISIDGVWDNRNYLGVLTNGIYAWGSQLEVKPKATSYIPTVATSVTRQADTFTGTGLIYTSATDARPLWSSATTYAVGAVVRYNNKVYESLQATNLNKQPDINPTWWLDLGADNISAAFDGKVGSKTTSTDVLRMIVHPGTNIDSVAYVETTASLITTSVVDEQYNIVYTQNSGLDSSVIEDWYDYFFIDPLGDPITQVVHQGINPIDPNLLIGVEIVRSGAVELGSFLTGQTTALGLTQYGVRAGIVDYSRKDVDEFGNISVVERAYSKRLEADIYVYNYDLNKVQRFLYNVRAVPVLWIATDDPELAEVSNVYGFYKDFSTTIAYPDVSLCSLQIEGIA